MIQEIVDGADAHMANSIAVFGDELHRQDAKVVSFRAIYGGSAYAFFMDKNMPNFKLSKWEEIHAAFYAKYNVLGSWQNTNYELVCKQGWLQSFTGRVFVFKLAQSWDGGWQYSKPQVCNYIVQGTATGDLIPLVMVQIYKKLRQLELFDIKIINQVHDSLVLDCPKKDVDKLAEVCYYYFRRLPQTIKEFFGYDWKTPMDGEVKVGYNWSEMQKIKM